MVKYVLIVLAVVALAAGIYKIRMDDIAHWKRVGREELQSEIALAVQAADDETKLKQTEIKKQSAKVKDEIKRNNVGDRPVSPVIRDQLKRMRERRENLR